MPKTLTREDYAPEQGLFDDGEATITGAFFGVNEDYKAKSGITDDMLQIILEDDLLEKPVYNTFSLGGAMQWKASGDGTEVESGKKPGAHAFMRNARAYSLVEAMFKTVGGGNLEKGQDEFIKRGYFMSQSGFYIGFKAHWNRVKLPLVTGGESEVLLPSRFIAFVEFTKNQVKKVDAPEASLDGAIEMLLALAPGKDERELKKAIMADAGLKANIGLTAAVFNKGMLKDLVSKGKLSVGPDGKYI